MPFQLRVNVLGDHGGITGVVVSHALDDDWMVLGERQQGIAQLFRLIHCNFLHIHFDLRGCYDSSFLYAPASVTAETRLFRQTFQSESQNITSEAEPLTVLIEQ